VAKDICEASIRCLKGIILFLIYNWAKYSALSFSGRTKILNCEMRDNILSRLSYSAFSNSLIIREEVYASNTPALIYLKS
jgi:hypothetical protein